MAGSVSEEAIARRLVADGEGLGDDRRLSALYKNFISWSQACSSSKVQSAKEKEKMLRSLFDAIDNSEMMVKKSTVICQMNYAEAEYYRHLRAKIEEQIKCASERIGECKQQLQEAKQIRKHRQEYDLMAKMIEQQPTRADTQRKLEQIDSEIRGLETRRKQLEDAPQLQIEKKKKQLHCFLTEGIGLIDDEDEQLFDSLNPQRTTTEEDEKVENVKESAQEEAMDIAMDGDKNEKQGK